MKKKLKHDSTEGNNDARFLPGSKYWTKFFRYKGNDGGQKYPHKPFLTGETAALTALNRKNCGSNGVELEK